MRCIGIDLAWSPRNTSGGFALDASDGTARQIAWRAGLHSDGEIIAFIAQASGSGPALVAIDAPIAVPNENGARPCDREVTRVFGRFQAGAHPANRRILRRYGGPRAERLAGRIAAELGFAHDPYIARHTTRRQLIEVYPHPGMVTLFGLERTLKYKRGPVSQRRIELERLQSHILALDSAIPKLQLEQAWRREIMTLRGHQLKQYEDLLDSLFCAYTMAYCWHHGPEHYQVFGDIQDGHILVPIPPQGRQQLALPSAELTDGITRPY
jgi:predicted RNase H-like nuclease